VKVRLRVKSVKCPTCNHEVSPEEAAVLLETNNPSQLTLFKEEGDDSTHKTLREEKGGGEAGEQTPR